MTVFATLPTKSTQDTQLCLDNDRKQLSLVHDGQHASIQLPAALASVSALAIPKGSIEEYSFRLPIDADDLLTLSRYPRCVKEYPWSASELTGKTRVACRSCHHDLFANTMLEWKDLPSENWAEMMDFWHCHKPDTPEASKHVTNGATRGYSASNQIGSVPGVVLVDVSHFFLSHEDCPNIQV